MSKRSTQEISDLEHEIVARLATLKSPNTQSMRVLRVEFSKRLTSAAPELVVGLAMNLARRADNFPRFFAYELIQHHPPALRSLKAGDLEDLGKNIDTWGAVDAFACYLAGPTWREQRVSNALIRRWARAPDRWWRRTALVSTVALNSKARGGIGDTVRTLMICEMLFEDRDDMVVKALSWALRELSKRDPHSVRKFLDKHAAVLAARVVREVNNKLKTGLKNPRPRPAAK
jgi:3-methyladenine DNA glycosylase AlkD